MTLELIANYVCPVGENPLWNPLDHQLYWLDIPSGTIYRYDPMTNAHEVFYQGNVTGGFTIQADGSLLLFGAGGRISRLHQGQITTIIESLPGEENNRFNDVVTDPEGCVLCGTMPHNSTSQSGTLYRLERDGSVKTLWENIRLSNGMGFSLDHKTFYYSDSRAHTVTQFDRDPASGEISNPRLFATLPADDGDPDGLTVDSEGFIWLAVWDGSRLIRYDPAGKIEREIVFPVKKVSSLTFGGDDERDIYITTAGGDNLAHNGELAGALFRLRQEIRGRPEYLSRIQIAD
jgi:D-xylono/L-arabinono-1,4-lactonase